MRLVRSGVRAAIVAVLFAVPSAAPASAQGFFQQLFGSAAPQPSPPPQSAPMLTPGGRPYAMPYSAFVPRRPSGDDEERQSSSKFKTMCVRTCDGFYFPISNSTTRRGFYRDQMRCRSACGDDARLFHLPAGATDVAEASDANGKIYGMLPTAYRYRKTIVAGCQCRPMPWSEVEMSRHQQYAMAEADKQAQQKAEIAARAAADKTIGEKADAAEAGEVDPPQVLANAKVAPAKISASQKPGALAAVVSSRQRAALAAPRHPAVPTPPPAASSGYSWPGDPPRR